MLNIGIIGTGLIAREHALAISMVPGCASLIAAADVAPERLQDFCASFRVPRRYRDVSDLIADPDVDLVAITTPPSAHEVLAVAALDAGKYVFCEKPLAHSLSSAAQIVEAEARHPGRLAVSHQLRYDPSFRRLIWLCSNGWIGEIQSALIERHSYVPHSNHGKKGWWGSWKVAGGGVLMTQLIHELDLLLLVMGRPLSVSAVMDTRYTEIESEDYVEATIRFAGEAAARCVASVNSGRLRGGFTIQGSSGTVGLPWNFTTKDPSRMPKAMKELDRALPDTRPESPSLVNRGSRFVVRRLGVKAKPALTPHARLYQEIADNIKSGDPLPIPPSEALGPLELCVAAYESALAGKEIRLPLGKTSSVYAGISKGDYDARQCSRTPKGPVLTVSNSSTIAPYESSFFGSVGRVALGIARRALGLVNVEPALVKAMMRKPPPVRGGPRARRWPWPRRRNFDRRERRAAMRVLDREIRTGGAVVYGGVEERAYSEAFARCLGGGYAKAVNSGTTALYVALRALDLEPGSEVVVPPMTDPGGTMPVALLGCLPIPADAHRGSINTSAEEIEKVLTNRTAAILVAHISGQPLDMDPVLELASKCKIPVVEDCAQAHGALYKGRMVGSLGAISAFSTMYAKHHATGAQGGVVFTKDAHLFERVKQIADRGKPYGARGARGNVMASLNFNQDEVSMAIGRVQLEKLPRAIAARRAFASWVETGLREVDGVSLIGDPSGCSGSYLFLVLRFDTSKLGCDCQGFANALLEEGIEGVFAGYPVFPTDQPWYRDAVVFGKSGLPWAALPGRPRPTHFELTNARHVNREIVRVDIHESLGIREAKDLVIAIKKITRFYNVYYTDPCRKAVTCATQSLSSVGRGDAT
jgi:dTDP-4-amino-4,6-dideoxygalactose transaminase/predicted dehydrogenase